jgi:hypothetical protein
VPPSTKLALIFDFDDTLVPDSATLLLQKYGIDTKKFWETELTALIRKGYDPTLGFLKLLLDNIGSSKPLGDLTNSELRKFGATLDSCFYPGIPELFIELRDLVSKFKYFTIDFYIISGGLQEIITGSKIVRDNFTAVYGCQLEESGRPPRIKCIKRAISFTEKTRYIFEINKGINPADSITNPYLVNSDVPQDIRNIPFMNMIYVGDIPCFSLLTHYGGTAFGVFDPANPAKAKRAYLEFLQPHRVVGMHAPNYQKDKELGSLLRVAVTNRINQIVVAQQTAGFRPPK